MKLFWGKSLYPLAWTRITSGALEMHIRRLVVQAVSIASKESGGKETAAK